MTILDIILLILLIPGAIRGISKGFLEQAVSLGGIILAVYIAYHFSQPVCAWLAQYITVSETVIHVIGFTVLLLGVLIVVMFAAKLLTQVADMASLGWINRVLGFVFSLAVSAVILGLLIILFDTLNTQLHIVEQKALNDSVLYYPLKDMGYKIFPYLKGLLTLGQ